MCTAVFCEPTCCGGPYSLFATSVSMCLCIIALNSFKITASCIHVFWKRDIETWSETYIIVFYMDAATSGLLIIVSVFIITKAWRKCYLMLQCMTVFFLLLTCSRMYCTATMFAMGEADTEDGVAEWVRFTGDVSSIIVFMYSAAVFWGLAKEIYECRLESSSSDSDSDDIEQAIA